MRRTQQALMSPVGVAPQSVIAMGAPAPFDLKMTGCPNLA